MQSRTASTSSTNRTSNSKLPQEENMTDDKLAALGKKAARAKRWRWLPGMLTTDGLRVLDAPPDAPATPDFSDAPTFGGLVAIFRATFPTPKFYYEAYKKADPTYDVSQLFAPSPTPSPAGVLSAAPTAPPAGAAGGTGAAGGVSAVGVGGGKTLVYPESP